MVQSAITAGCNAVLNPLKSRIYEQLENGKTYPVLNVYNLGNSSIEVCDLERDNGEVIKGIPTYALDRI